MRLNRVSILVGPSDFGKSTVVRKLCLEHLTAYKSGLALIHDPHSNFSDMCRVYQNTDEWRAAYDASRKPGGKKIPRGASIRGSSSAVRDLAREIGERRNKKEDVQVPIFLTYDEVTLMDSSGKTFASEEDLAMLGNRVHWGVHQVANVQSVTGLNDAWFDQSTEVYMFSLNSPSKVIEACKRLGLKPNSLDNMLDAPPFHYVQWKKGQGLV